MTTRVPIKITNQKCPYGKSFGYIYVLINKTNKHKYVGKHVYRRTSEPYVDAKYWGSGAEHLQNALKKLNGDKSKFDKIILDWVEQSGDDVVDSVKLANLEIHYIALLNTWKNPKDYNETPGGDSWFAGELNPMYGSHRFSGKNSPNYGKIGPLSPCYGRHHTEESKRLMSEKAKLRCKKFGYPNPDKFGVPLPGEKNPFYGRHHTEETKQKISKANKGRRLCGEQNGMYGKHHTPEARRKMSEARSGPKNCNYGKHPSNESKLKNRLAHLGKTHTPEHKQHLKNMWAKPVSQYLPNGELYKSYPYGALSIGRNLHISGKKIWELCCEQNEEIYEGYIWKFTNYESQFKST